MKWNLYKKDDERLISGRTYIIAVPKINSSGRTYEIKTAYYYVTGTKIKLNTVEIEIQESGFFNKEYHSNKEGLYAEYLIGYDMEDILWNYLPEVQGYDNQNGDNANNPRTMEEIKNDDALIFAMDHISNKIMSRLKEKVISGDIIYRATVAVLKIYIAYSYIAANNLDNAGNVDVPKVCFELSQKLGITRFPKTFIAVGANFSEIVKPVENDMYKKTAFALQLLYSVINLQHAFPLIKATLEDVLCDTADAISELIVCNEKK